MPHTNRKKKNGGASQKKVVVHTKRKEVLDDEGWTHVVDKPQPKPDVSTTNSEAKEKQELWAIAADFKIGNSYYVDRTLEEYEVEYSRARKTWGKSEACRQLKIILEGKTEEERDVSNVVCLGLGSLQNARGEGRKASFLQLVALSDFIEALSSQELKVTFQDPAFTDLDIEFLSTLDFAVQTDPDAFELITEKTMVYAIHCYADIYEKVARRGGGKVIVCTDVEKFGGPSSSISDSTIKILEVMVDGYEKMEFPQIRSDFSDTKIYWRRSSDSAPLIEEAEIARDVEVSTVAQEKKEVPVEPANTPSSVAALEEKVEQQNENPVEAEVTSDIVSAPEVKLAEENKPVDEPGDNPTDVATPEKEVEHEVENVVELEDTPQIVSAPEERSEEEEAILESEATPINMATPDKKIEHQEEDEVLENTPHTVTAPEEKIEEKKKAVIEAENTVINVVAPENKLEYEEKNNVVLEEPSQIASELEEKVEAEKEAVVESLEAPQIMNQHQNQPNQVIKSLHQKHRHPL
ncbi:hypothetical protein M7I_3922 [Glarea lozoyensis 74030]|uniref:SRR1-like domain-containing protein n=1 Tax=Glarea lozoyensis (strain ATCC 74030 / MF5533) TaxID=1104152 RepID=H0EMS5_GLAL7|nr:hypothetical protein M7I_3922 [Glarea lozoyensis 74030]